MAISAGKQDELAAKAGTLLVRIGMIILMVVLPVAAIYSRRFVFSLMPVGAALILVGALLMPGHRLLGKTRKALSSPALVTALCLLVWVGLSLAWTPVLSLAAERFAKTAATLALAFVVITYLPSQSRTSNLNLLPIGAGITAIATAALVLAAPVALPSAPLEATTLERAAIGLVLLVWPALAALALRERWALAGILAVAVAGAAIAVWTPAAMAGMAVGALVVSLATSNPRWLGWCLGVFGAALLLLAPAIPLIFEQIAPVPGVPLPVSKAMAAWSQITIADPWRLIAAYGLDTLPRGVASGFLPADTPRSILFELWFEHGALGGLIGAAIVLGVFASAARASPPVAPFMLAGYACVLTIAVWGLATLQLWWVTIASVMAIGFSCSAKGQPRKQRPAAPQSARPQAAIPAAIVEQAEPAPDLQPAVDASEAATEAQPKTP